MPGGDTLDARMRCAPRSGAHSSRTRRLAGIARQNTAARSSVCQRVAAAHEDAVSPRETLPQRASGGEQPRGRGAVAALPRRTHVAWLVTAPCAGCVRAGLAKNPAFLLVGRPRTGRRTGGLPVETPRPRAGAPECRATARAGARMRQTNGQRRAAACGQADAPVKRAARARSRCKPSRHSKSAFPRIGDQPRPNLPISQPVLPIAPSSPRSRREQLQRCAAAMACRVQPGPRRSTGIAPAVRHAVQLPRRAARACAPRAATRPSFELSADAAFEAQWSALADNDTPSTDAGIEALYAFALVDLYQPRSRYFGYSSDLGQFEARGTAAVALAQRSCSLQS
jgi:hypothetical protein